MDQIEGVAAAAAAVVVVVVVVATVAERTVNNSSECRDEIWKDAGAREKPESLSTLALLVGLATVLRVVSEIVFYLVRRLKHAGVQLASPSSSPLSDPVGRSRYELFKHWYEGILKKRYIEKHPEEVRLVVEDDVAVISLLARVEVLLIVTGVVRRELKQKQKKTASKQTIVYHTYYVCMIVGFPNQTN